MSPYLGCKIAAITQTEDPFMKQLFGVNQQAIVIYRGTPLQLFKVSLNGKADLSELQTRLHIAHNTFRY